MEFWTLFNIAFVSGAGALSLFFLISTIAVAAKGKRKCNTFDVILRILSTLCFIAATALVLCAVLTVIDAPIQIKFNAPAVADDPLVPVFIMSGKEIVLPVAQLFLLFSTEIGVIIGFAISIVLFLCSLMALTVDCLVANKKVAKTPSVAAVKSAEQIKRERELERIKKIGESAVKKTAKVAEEEKASAITEPEKAEESEPDWRNEVKEEKSESAEFVGISQNTDDAFDTFDDPVQDRQEQSEEVTGEEYTDTEPVQAEEENIVEDSVFEEQPFEDDVESYAENVAQDIDVTDNNDIDSDTIENDSVYNDEFEEPQENTADFTQEEPIEQEETLEEIVSEKEPIAEENAETAGVALDNDNIVAEDFEPQAGDIGYDEIEPDRGIYIPEIRTIVKPNEEPEPELKPTPAKKRSAAKKPAQKSAGTAPATAKRASAKPEKSSVGEATKRSSAPKKNTDTDGDGTPAQEPKKLPVTRRYVILDRRNAVNMFGEYLRERNKADKEKLQSSINTIIIE